MCLLRTPWGWGGVSRAGLGTAPLPTPPVPLGFPPCGTQLEPTPPHGSEEPRRHGLPQLPAEGLFWASRESLTLCMAGQDPGTREGDSTGASITHLALLGPLGGKVVGTAWPRLEKCVPLKLLCAPLTVPLPQPQG